MFKVTKLENIENVEKLINASIRIFGNLASDAVMTDDRKEKYLSKKEKKLL